MNVNWESLIRAIVPLSFMAIWALTSLFNRDSKPKATPRLPPRPDGPWAGAATRSGDPILRFATKSAGERSNTPNRSVSRANIDDGIVILSSEPSRPERDREQVKRGSANAASKRASRGKPLVPQRRNEANAPRARLAGVSQNVNQHLANTNLELTPLARLDAGPALGLTGITPIAAVAVAAQSEGTHRSAEGLGLTDPNRIRQAFVLAEILGRPAALQPRRGGFARR